MRRTFPFICACTLTVSHIGSAQAGPTFVGAGYGVPAYARFAPGQIVTLQVSGMKTVLATPVFANVLPLPTVLADISVSLRQNIVNSPNRMTIPVPLISVSQFSSCDLPPPAASDCIVTLITVQIPFEAQAPTRPPNPELIVSENGVDSKAFAISVATDNIHVITASDITAFGGKAAPLHPPSESVVTHADGTRVDVDSPAKPSEIVTIWAWGLGNIVPRVATGVPTPTPAPTLATQFLPPIIQFEFRANGGPLLGFDWGDPSTKVDAPVFAGAVPGEVGLYILNVRLPDDFPPIQPCTLLPVPIGKLNASIYSNLTIRIRASASSDAASICVAP
jgi:uncharacterized protein (TIGR03437 family)